jgi:hypothetical protein
MMPGYLRPLAVSRDGGDPVLYCDVLPGVSLQAAGLAALSIAQMMQCPVHFDFNDAAYIVDPETFVQGWML